MPISYPITQPQTASSNTANYLKYAVGLFSENAGIVQNQAYTASFDAAAWIFFVSASVPAPLTMSIAVPTASYMVGGGPSAPQLFAPAFEFWRTDPSSSIEVRLSSSNPEVVFGFGSGTSTFIIPSSSYSNLVQLDEGFGTGGFLRYIVLEQSNLP